MQKWSDLGFGVCLKPKHYQEFLEERPAVDWLEVHTENYFGDGGLDLYVLEKLRCDYPFSLHGVGLGLGSVHGFSKQHLEKVGKLVKRIEPALVSEHLCWGAVQDRNLNDLLPLNLTDQALILVCERVQQIQESLNRPILLENVSTYLRYQEDTWTESGFLAEVVKRTGCGILLDVNNLYVNLCNHKENPLEAMANLPLGCVGEIHLAGHLVTELMVIDDHGSEVCSEVWNLYQAAISKFGRLSSLIEWDTNLPPLSKLLAQTQLARQYASEIVLNETSIEQVRITAKESNSDSINYQEKFSDNLFSNQIDPSIFAWFTGEQDKQEHGFGIYRGNIRAHWEIAFNSIFPVMKKLVGDEFFKGLVREYGLHYPSTNGDLNQFGEKFPDFLEIFEHVSQYPYFPDMARLEWALHRSYYAADANSVTAQELASLTPEALDETCFHLHPACKLLESEWSIPVIWSIHQKEPVQDFPDQMKVDSYMLVARKDWKPVVLELSNAAFTTLKALQNGQTLGYALDSALEIDENFAFTEQLQFWLMHGILTFK